MKANESIVRTWCASVAILATAIALAPRGAPAASREVPFFRLCSLESGVSRVRYVIDEPEGAKSVHLRFRFYDVKKKWLAEELIDRVGFDAPIYPVGGLFDPKTVATVECLIDGFDRDTVAAGMQTFDAVAPLDASGRKPCPKPDGLIVDGGDDASFEAAMIGPDWVLFRIRASVARFLDDQPTMFAGDVFFADLDRNQQQRAVLDGPEDQPVSLLFTDVRPGFHQIDYGPWPVEGSRPFCLRTP